MTLQKIGVLGLFFWLLTAACAGTLEKTEPAVPPETALKERVTAYWEAKMKGDLEKTYLLQTPDFRKRIRIVEYIKADAGGFLIKEARIESITIDGSSARVDLVIRTHLLRIRTPKKGITRHLADYWKFVDGLWYHTTPPRPKKRAKPLHTG